MKSEYKLLRGRSILRQRGSPSIRDRSGQENVWTDFAGSRFAEEEIRLRLGMRAMPDRNNYTLRKDNVRSESVKNEAALVRIRADYSG